MKSKDLLCGLSMAVFLQLGVLAGSAQTGQFLFTGSMTNITLEPGTYDFKAYGAQGGAFSGGGSGGLGAEMEGIFNFTTTTTLTLLVGGAGQYSANRGGGGGGGGSFVTETSAPLVVAGGGGGGGDLNDGGPGLTGTSGGGADGGTNGYGGGDQAWGGGGGYYGGGDAASGGGGSFLAGGAGGSGGAGANGGGYGGGGGGSESGGYAGGGGGGYSGGSGGGYGAAGGGGGSYIDSSAIADFTEISGVASPDDSPNGEIIITGGPGPLLTNILINPANAIIAVGTNEAFSATEYFTDGSVIVLGLTNGLVWSSSNPGVAAINSNGVATALSPGSTTITATDGRISLNATLFVLFPAGGTNIFLFTGTITNIAMSPGVYSIAAYGARGGNGDGSAGALGAEMEAQFGFGTTTTLTLLVGGGGNGGGNFGEGAGGGGGGSFVVSGSTPLVVAGGGGGGCYGFAGIPASITTSGSTGGGSLGFAGAGGAGGQADGAGGGGGGFNGSGGGTMTSGGSDGGGGSGYFNGGTGGSGNSPGGDGGYGGGGGAGGGSDGFHSGGGGGGGFSGGGGGGGGYYFNGGGGGGASYIDPSAMATLTEFSGVASPDGSANGEIIIESLPTNNIYILTQPLSQAVAGGQTATFNVLAVYSPPFSYQWSFNGTNIPGATNATYSIPDVQPDNDGAYRVVVSDAVTNISSSNALLSVIYPPPVIVLQPTNSEVIVGSNATFSASATSYYPMSFQWQFNGTNLVDGGQISGSANSTLTISSADVANVGSYQFIASNSYGAVTSSMASLAVLNPIQIIAQPANQILLPGSNAAFSVTATGSISMYQWYFDGVALTDDANVSGSMSASLTLTNIQAANYGNYAVVLANAFFSSPSSNALLINPTPVIVSSPTNLEVISGSNAVFSIYATNYLPLSFQWQFNGTNLSEGGQISGSTNSVLTIAGAEGPSAGNYQVIAFDDYAATTSSIASLAVYAPPQIVGQPSSETVLSGSNISFTVTTTGSLLHYQWYCNGLPLTNNGSISGVTNYTLEISNVQTNNEGVYWVWVTSLSSGEASSNATLTVYNPAQIVTQPANAGILLGSNVSFTASATGTAVAYQWYFDGISLTDNGHVTGSLTPTLSIINVGSSDGGDYHLVVTNLLSSAASRPATLTPLASLAPSIRYVNLGNSTPLSPYLSWSNAATSIQTAVYASLDGDDIIVTNGVYQSGGYAVPGDVASVVITNNLTLQSVNGSSETSIDGSNSMGCVYLANHATLNGFTLTNGHGYYIGGAYCSSTNPLIENCVIVNNTRVSNNGRYATYGGIYGGTLSNCTIMANSFIGVGFSTLYSSLISSNSGGAYNSVLNDCTISSNGSYGAYRCTLNNSVISNNVSYGIFGSAATGCKIDGTVAGAKIPGGNCGADSSTLTNCILEGNGPAPYTITAQNSTLVDSLIANNPGGGAVGSTLINCTVANNPGVGAMECSLLNSIIYYNTNGNTSANRVMMNCCTFPLPNGYGLSGNFTNPPLFVNITNDFHLQSNSPCINAGNNACVTTATDLDGNPRIVVGTVDLGAYEYQSPVSMVSYQWLEQYGLLIANNVDTSDPNGTGYDVYQDWLAGLNPTNSASVLTMFSPAPSNNPFGITVSWQSVNGIKYNLQRSTNLSTQAPFSTIESNITGQIGTTRYTDTTATNGTTYFYRVAVP